MDTGVSGNKTPGRAIRRHFNSKFHVTSRHLSKMFNEVQGKEISGTIIKMFKQMNTSGEQKLLRNREVVKVLVLNLGQNISIFGN